MDTAISFNVLTIYGSFDIIADVFNKLKNPRKLNKANSYDNLCKPIRNLFKISIIIISTYNHRVRQYLVSLRKAKDESRESPCKKSGTRR